MMNRRDFFRVVAASGATAAASGCQRATETILPLVVPNEQIVPGVAAWFATVCRECPAGCGVIAKNREGRVVKLEGNPDHPVNQGALCARGQAALQGLYHPDRFTGPRLRDGAALKPVPWDAAQKVVADKLADLRSAAKGQAIALVTQLETSSLGALLDKWTQALGTRPRVTFEPFAYEALRAANRITFGRDAIPYFAFEDAEVVLSFGADFLETWLSNVNYARTFARMHTVRDGRAGTFIHVEPRQSLTASNADEWVRNAPGTEGQLALAMLKVMVDERLADRDLEHCEGQLPFGPGRVPHPLVGVRRGQRLPRLDMDEGACAPVADRVHPREGSRIVHVREPRLEEVGAEGEHDFGVLEGEIGDRV